MSLGVWSPVKIEYADYTDCGKRGNNEDCHRIQITPDSTLAVVADGLGGYANGEVASKIAVDTIFDALQDKRIDEETLIYAIIKASDFIRDASIGGYSTAAALWIGDHDGVAAHVGDSRIYQFRDGRIIFQSTDHSAVQMAVLVGELEPDALRHHKNRNRLFRVLGKENESPKADSTELSIQPGDRFLLCSDGFWEPVTEEDMLRTIQETADAEQWLEAMKKIVTSARNPRQDNYTAVCIVAKKDEIS